MIEIGKIKELFKEQGFLDASWTNLSSSLSFETYKAQIWNQNTGSMEFLTKHTGLKDPKKQSFQSAFVGLFPYFPTQNTLKSNLKVALYAQSEDYHIILNKKLSSIIESLKISFPNEDFKSAVDSFPVLERDLAYRAGLGWICLLYTSPSPRDQRGSRMPSSA